MHTQTDLSTVCGLQSDVKGHSTSNVPLVGLQKYYQGIISKNLTSMTEKLVVSFFEAASALCH